MNKNGSSEGKMEVCDGIPVSSKLVLQPTFRKADLCSSRLQSLAALKKTSTLLGMLAAIQTLCVRIFQYCSHSRGSFDTIVHSLSCLIITQNHFRMNYCAAKFGQFKLLTLIMFFFTQNHYRCVFCNNRYSLSRINQLSVFIF